MKQMIAFCGLDCEKCEAYLATRNNDDALRASVAEKWSKLNGVLITPEMINCAGCRAQGVKTLYCASLCAIRQCALSKSVETCRDCAGWETCQTLGAITRNSEEALINLKGSNR